MDPLLDRFSDLPAFPGKRAPVNRSTPVVDTSPQVWDEKPTFYNHKGKLTEFFTISHLSVALGRKPVTIRSWENKGLMPKSPYRSPRPQRGSIPGKEAKGRRLWTRPQIEGILKIAREEQVILNGKPPTPAFARKVSNLFITLQQEEHTSL